MRKSVINIVLAAVVLFCGTSSLIGSQPCPPPLPPIVN